MVSADEALSIILDSTGEVSRESVTLRDAHGRILARDVRSPSDIPPFENSAMDGFAVLASDAARASAGSRVTLRIAGESRAGHPFAGTLRGGDAVRIMTGGMMPRGADAVIPAEEATCPDDSHVMISSPVPPAAFVRSAGEDIARGMLALRKGGVLNPGAIGVLASIGVTRVLVARRPLVRIVSTGDELVEPGKKPGRGQIRNSSGPLLAALIDEAGGEPRLAGIIPDNRSRLRRAFARALKSDCVIVTGGVSVGAYDYVRDVMLGSGVSFKFWQANIKPGRPLAFGTAGKTLVFGLPGNPVSTGITFLRFVRPAIWKMQGRKDAALRGFMARLEHDYAKSDGKRHFLRGLLTASGGELHVRTTGSQSSGVLSSLATANCLIIVPEDVTALKAGDRVLVELL